MLEFLNDWLWGKLLIGALLALGLWFTLATRFVQLRHFVRMFTVFGDAFQPAAVSVEISSGYSWNRPARFGRARPAPKPRASATARAAARADRCPPGRGSAD